jgi:hypothetical protein
MIPILLFLPVIVSGFQLIVELREDELSRPRLALLLGWFALAAWLQFRGRSSLVSTIGVITQVALAVYLRIRLILGGASA